MLLAVVRTFSSEHRTKLLLLVLGLFLLPASATAKLCGNHVGGRRVPCACGDIVASDLVLTDDPVGNSVCPGDGLIVRAIGATHGVTVDLRGALEDEAHLQEIAGRSWWSRGMPSTAAASPRRSWWP